MTPEEFKALVESHDLTYERSDDSKAYQRGSQSMKRILEARELLPRSVAIQIWNEVVARKLIPEVRNQFEWRE